MNRRHLLGLSTTVAAIVLTTGASPATAGAGCRTTMSGGLVGQEVIASSSDVYAEAAPTTQRVTIDRVSVNYFGQTRYRLAAPIELVSAHGAGTTSFTGGKGYYVSGQDLALTARFAKCSKVVRD